MKKITYWDTATTGFILEVRPNGATYALRYIDKHGVQRQTRIGGLTDLTFAEAEKKAKRLRSEIVLGGNPAEAKAAVKAIPTYAEIAQRQLDQASTYQRSYNTTEMYMRRHILPRWGKLRVSDIRQPDVAQWLAEKSCEGLAVATVAKIAAIFSRTFALAMQWDTPGVVRNPALGIKRPPINNARNRYLTLVEALRLQRAVAASHNPQLKHIVGLLLLTGARVSELLQAEWHHVDIDRRAWLIPTSKTGKPRFVPLSQAAIDIISALPKFDRCPYLVTNPETKQPFVSIKHSWQTARRDARLPGFRIHDLRHSAASFMINAGVDLYSVGSVLGHASTKTTERYAHLSNETLLAAVEAGAGKLQGGWSGSGGVVDGI